MDLGAGDSSTCDSLSPELSIEVVDEVHLILVRDLVFAQTTINSSESFARFHVSLHRSLEGSPLSSLSGFSGFCSSNSVLHNGNVMNSDSADIGVSGNVVNVVLAEIFTNISCSSSAGDLARLHEDIAIDPVEEGKQFGVFDTAVLQVRVDQSEGCRLLEVTFDSFGESKTGSFLLSLVDVNLMNMVGDNSGNIGDDGVASDAVGSEDSCDVFSGIRGRDGLRSRENVPDAGQSLVSLASLDTLLSELGINLSESLALGKSFLGGDSLRSASSGLNSSQVRGVVDKDLKESLSVSSGNLSEQFVVLRFEGVPAP